MNLFQRLLDALGSPPHREPELPPPPGVYQMERMISELQESTRELKKEIDKPMGRLPSIADVLMDPRTHRRTQ